MKRYFIYSASYSHPGGGVKSSGYFITNDCYPSKNVLLTHHSIRVNLTTSCVVTEVKSCQDIKDYFGFNEVLDEINYPPN